MTTRCAECHKTVSTSDHVSCECGDKYCSSDCKDISSAKYHRVLCPTSYRRLDSEIVMLGETSSSRYVCLILRLIAMVASAPAILNADGRTVHVTPLDSSHMKLLHRLTDVEASQLESSTQIAGISLKAGPVGHLIKMDDLLKKYLGKLYTQNPSLDLDFLAQMFALLQCNSYRIIHGKLSNSVRCWTFFYNVHEMN